MISNFFFFLFLWFFSVFNLFYLFQSSICEFHCSPPSNLLLPLISSFLSLFSTIHYTEATSHAYLDFSLLSTPLPFSPLHKPVKQPVHQATTAAPCVRVTAAASATVFSSLTYNNHGRTLHRVPGVSVVIILQLAIKLAWLQVWSYNFMVCRTCTQLCEEGCVLTSLSLFFYYLLVVFEYFIVLIIC